MQDNASSRDAGPDPVSAGAFSREPSATRGAGRSLERLEVDLVAAVLAIQDEQPVVLLADPKALRLPTCSFEPSRHETLDSACRQGVFGGFGFEPAHMEQLASHCTSASDGRGTPLLSIGYLALARPETLAHIARASMLRIYDALPWEDWRSGRPACLADTVVPALTRWLETSNAADESGAICRSERVRIAFGLGESRWDDERVLERLEILEQAGLLTRVSPPALDRTDLRFIAAALGRLRARIRHRPVVFDLLPAQFTLFELQRAVEGILGPHLHKQNFRRLVESMGLVEPTGEVRSHTGGRPARLFRFRPAVMLERAAPGMRIKSGKAA